MSDIIDPFEGGHLSDEEKELLARNIQSGADVNPVPKIPDAPDISKPPRKKKGGVPGMLKNSIEGLTELSDDELPEPGKHYVIFGSQHLNDTKARPVKRKAPMTLAKHVEAEIHHTQLLLDRGLKNPKVWTNPVTGASGVGPDFPGAVLWDRIDRTAHYARWRYRGYVCGEVQSL